MPLSKDSERKSVFIVEDSDAHAAQIREVALREGFKVGWSRQGGPVELLSYKALFPGTHLIIVDLDLGVSEDGDTKNGYKVINDDLWPADRGAIFLIFSPSALQKPDALFGPIMPTMVFLLKEVDENDNITEACLQTLATRLNELNHFVRPSLNRIELNPLPFATEIIRYCETHNLLKSEYWQVATDSLAAAVGHLDMLIDGCSDIAEIGDPSRRIAVGVYGSCGRFESRRDSDVEFSIFFTQDGGDALAFRRTRSAALAGWNRVARLLTEMHVPYEGQSKIANNRSGLLLENQIEDVLPDVAPPNRYVPLIALESVTKANLEQTPHARNRQFQLLTETRAVFNASLLASAKRDLWERYVGPGVRDPRLLLASRYFRDLQRQFMLDATWGPLERWRHLKRFSLRAMNVFALRLWTVGVLIQRGAPMKDEEWNQFHDDLCAPGVLKIIRAAGAVDGIAGCDGMRDRFAALLQQYFFVLDGLSTGGQTGDEVGANKVAEQIRSHAVSLGEAMSTILRDLSTAVGVRYVADAHPWLFDISELTSRLKEV